MGPLKPLAALVAILLTVSSARAGDVERWRPLMAEASARFRVPIDWIERVIQIESHGQTMLDGRPITSSAGAMGLMQLMPETWAVMRARLGLGDNPHNPKDNILAGTFYMRLMYERFGYPGLFGAYNAGPARYADFIAGHRRLPQETSAYVAEVAEVRRSAKGRDHPANSEHATLFFLSSNPPTSMPRPLPRSDVLILPGQMHTP